MKRQRSRRQRQRHWMTSPAMILHLLIILGCCCPISVGARTIQRATKTKSTKSAKKKGPVALGFMMESDSDNERGKGGSMITAPDKATKGGKKKHSYYDDDYDDHTVAATKPPTLRPTASPTVSPSRRPSTELPTDNKAADKEDILVVFGQDDVTGKPLVYNVTQQAALIAQDITGRGANDFLLDLIYLSPNAPLGSVCLMAVVAGHEEYYVNTEQDTIFYIAQGHGFLHMGEYNAPVPMGLGSFTLIQAGQGPRSFFNTHSEYTVVVACLTPAVSVQFPMMPVQNVQSPTQKEILNSEFHFQTLGTSHMRVDLKQAAVAPTGLQWDILYTSTRDYFLVASLVINPNTAEMYHSYSETQVWYVVIQGQHVAISSAAEEDCWILLKPGDGIFVPIGTPHKLIHYGDVSNDEDAIVFAAFSPGLVGGNNNIVSSSHQAVEAPASYPSCPLGTVPAHGLVS